MNYVNIEYNDELLPLISIERCDNLNARNYCFERGDDCDTLLTFCRNGSTL